MQKSQIADRTHIQIIAIRSFRKFLGNVEAKTDPGLKIPEKKKSA